jgi:predicted Zn-dependent peptidase
MKTPEMGLTSAGLRVATCVVPGVETVAINLLADTGARFEPARLNGLAHLFEHMVFKGSERRSARDIAEAIEDVGGQLNAWTSRDATAFHARLLARDLPLGLDLLADMLVNPRFDEEELAREKHVVLQELGEARDTPDDIVFDHLQEAAFPGQALGRSILGSEETLAAITADDLRSWRDTHYQPERLILAVAGRIDHDEVMRLADAALPARGVAGARLAAEPLCFRAGRHEDNRRCEQAQLTMGLPAPGHHDPAHDAALLFVSAVGGGMSSRLFQEVREARGLAYSVSAAMTPYVDGGLVSVHAACAREEADAARALIDEVLAGAVRDLSQAELDRARAQAVAGLLMALESPQGQADHVARCLAIHGRFLSAAELVARLEGVTLEAARAAGAAMLAHAPARAEIGAAKRRRRAA